MRSANGADAARAARWPTNRSLECALHAWQKITRKGDVLFSRDGHEVNAPTPGNVVSAIPFIDSFAVDLLAGEL